MARGRRSAQPPLELAPQRRPATLAESIEAAGEPQRLRPRVFIEASDLARQTHVTGVQRVAFELARAARSRGWGQAVRTQGERLYALASRRDGETELEIQEGDILLLTHPAEFDRVAPAVEAFKRKQGKIYCVVHDIIPVIHPAFCFDRASAKSHQDWFLHMLADADGMIAISEAVRDQILDFVNIARPIVNPQLKIAWSRHGFDFHPIGGGAPAADPSEDRDEKTTLAQLIKEANFFLSVGTVEIRKGHGTALDAFERLWAEGFEAKYVVVGQPGWRADALLERMETHPELGKKLIWLSDVSDADLTALYGRARALVQASVAEGFGLPIVEAGARNTPVVVSDIPVFREICGAHALYFSILDAGALHLQLKNVLSGGAPAPDFPLLTWEESTATTFALLRDQAHVAERWRSIVLSPPTPERSAAYDAENLARKRHAYISGNLIDEYEFFAQAMPLFEARRSRRLRLKPPRLTPPLFVKEAYWTITRLLGLGYLHDGSRALPPPPRAAEPISDPIPDWTDARKLGHVVKSPATAPRVLVEAGFLRRCKHIAGIFRVAFSLALAAEKSGRGVAVRVEDDVIKPLFENGLDPALLKIAPGDILLLTHVSFHQEVAGLIKRIKENNGRVVSLIYDIEIFKNPGLASNRETINAHFDWFLKMLEQSDEMIAISRYVANDVIAFVRKTGAACNPNLKIAYSHLGGDFCAPQSPPSAAVADILTGPEFFLSVGAIEPRKGYLIALDAFERLWAQNSPARYVICGRPGWRMRALVKRIENHPEFGKKLIWLKNVGDSDLSRLYLGARALIQPAIAEGFGLPLIEAAFRGAPMIVSDISVFHEVCGDHALYFAPMESESLAEKISEALAGAAPAPNFPILTWAAAAQGFLDLAVQNPADAENETVWRRVAAPPA